MSLPPEVQQRLLIALEWMCEEDSTYDQPGNEYWITGYEFCCKVLAEAKGEEYEPGEWKNWNPDMLKEFEDAINPPKNSLN